MFQHLTKEEQSSTTTSPFGDQNIGHLSTLIDCAPHIELLTSNFNEKFINVPNVSEPPLLLPQVAGIVRTMKNESIPYTQRVDCSLRILWTDKPIKCNSVIHS
jgi:hypothetical protein